MRLASLTLALAGALLISTAPPASAEGLAHLAQSRWLSRADPLHWPPSIYRPHFEPDALLAFRGRAPWLASAYSGGVAAGRGELWIDRVWFDRLPLTLKNRAERGPWLLESRFATATLGGVLLASRLSMDGPDSPRWTGGILLDDELRDGLRFESERDRQRAADASDVLQGVLWAWLAVDTALVRDRRVQGRLWKINADAMLASFLATEFTKFGVGRERPDRSNNRSFVSGHATAAATAAGLLCTHHLRGRLYGRGWADRLACGASAAAALGTGVLRLSADRHWATDVATGWGMGFLFGYLLPARWYYAGGDDAAKAPESLLLPVASRNFVGFFFVRRF